MGNSKNPSSRWRNPIILMLFLLVSTINNGRSFMAEGRAIEKPAPVNDGAGDLEEADEQFPATKRKLIGSRPPRCEKRCRECGHCEAVQVPIVPRELEKEGRRRGRAERPEKAMDYSRGGDVSNYKPLSWKCKCGDFIFNP